MTYDESAGTDGTMGGDGHDGRSHGADGGGLIEYRHPMAGFSLPVPASWERIVDPQPGVALVAVEPEHELGFRANLVVTVEDLSAELDLQSWQAAAEGMLDRVLDDFLLLDREYSDIDGNPVIRRLAHHAQREAGPVTMEQWALTRPGAGYTLTASVGTWAYHHLSELFTEVARHFYVEPELV